MAKKKSKAPKKAKAAKAKPSRTKKSKVKKAKAKPAKKTAPARKSKTKKSKKPVTAKPAKKKPAKKKKQIIGEGNYQASRKFDRDQSAFVKKNEAAIPAIGKAAEAALDGPGGDALRQAEATAADRSRDIF